MTAPPPANARFADGGSVLVVDNDADLADSLVMLLRLDGWDARSAYSGAQALALARHWRPGLALIDLAMPGTGGLDLARSLRVGSQGARPMRLMALAGWDDLRRTPPTCREAGFEACLCKPLDLPAFYRLLGEGGGPARPAAALS